MFRLIFYEDLVSRNRTDIPKLNDLVGFIIALVAAIVSALQRKFMRIN
jgi:hypothetical protein